MNTTLLKVIDKLINLAKSYAESTDGPTDDMVIALVRSIFDKYAPSFAVGPAGANPEDEFRANLHDDDQAEFDKLIAACENCGSDPTAA